MTPYRAGDQLLVAASTIGIRAIEKIDPGSREQRRVLIAASSSGSS
jgi:hypothetical protein